MRALLQRVKSAEVAVEGEVARKIGNGLLIFLGIHKDDTLKMVPWLVQKVINLRIFGDEAGKMNFSLKDKGFGALIVSQFTLYGDCSNGRRPDFFSAMPVVESQALYERFVEEFQKEGLQVQSGRFQAHMEVSLINDGPVTILVETP